MEAEEIPSGGSINYGCVPGGISSNSFPPLKNWGARKDLFKYMIYGVWFIYLVSRHNEVNGIWKGISVTEKHVTLLMEALFSVAEAKEKRCAWRRLHPDRLKETKKNAKKDKKKQPTTQMENGEVLSGIRCKTNHEHPRVKVSFIRKTKTDWILGELVLKTIDEPMVVKRLLEEKTFGLQPGIYVLFGNPRVL